MRVIFIFICLGFTCKSSAQIYKANMDLMFEQIQEDLELEGFDEENPEDIKVLEQMKSMFQTYLQIENDSVKIYSQLGFENLVEHYAIEEFKKKASVTDSIIVLKKEVPIKFYVDKSNSALATIESIKRNGKNNTKKRLLFDPKENVIDKDFNRASHIDTVYNRKKINSSFSYSVTGNKTYNALSEIYFVVYIKDTIDFNLICDDYEKDRIAYRKIRFETPDKAEELLRRKLEAIGVSEKSRDIFTSQWISIAKEQYERVVRQNDQYKEGVECLQNLLENEILELNNYLSTVKSDVEALLSSEELIHIQKGIDGYNSFNSRKKKEFFDTEKKMYLGFGDNIVKYNQLSFDLIELFPTSEYDFGINTKFKKFVLSLYDNHKELNEIHSNYFSKEKEVVEKVSSYQCKKRIGIIRYYDALGARGIERASKINMIMNIFN